MVGHAVVVGALAVGQHDAARAGRGHVDLLVARAHAAHQFEGRHRRHLVGGQAGHADGQHRADVGTALGDGGRALGGLGGIAQVEVLGEHGLVFVRDVAQHQQGNLGRHL